MNLLVVILLLGIFVLVVLSVVAVVAGVAIKGKGNGSPTEVYPFQRSKHFLSNAERSFFEVLRRAVGNDVHVFVKVRLEDLLWLPKGTANRQMWLNKVRQKHVDFLLCDVRSVTPQLVIELDDSSHQSDRQRHRDDVKDQSLAAAGIPILRVPAQRAYSPQQLAHEIQRYLHA